MDARILPESFTVAYEALYMLGVDDGAGDSNHPLSGKGDAAIEKASGKPVHQWRVNSGHVTSIGKAGGGAGKAQTKKVGKTAKTMRSERMFRERVKIDKRLRRIAGEIKELIEAEVRDARNVDGKGRRIRREIGRLCVGTCRRIGEPDWNWCPNCGGRMMDRDTPV